MEIIQFFYVVEIADNCSFSQAARNLYISQPNLSHAVKQIEDKVGFPLFERTPKGVFPTPEGRGLIERFRILKREYEQLETFINTPRNRDHLHLNVAALNVNRTSIAFSQIIRQYMSSPINFSFLTYSYLDELLPLVEAAQVDFAIIGTLSPFLRQVRNRLDNHNIEYVPFANAPISVVVGPQNPLYQREGSVKLEELYPYTVMQYGSPAKAPNHSVPYVIGLSAHAYGEVHVTNGQLFYTTIQASTAIGLVAASPENFALFNRYENLRALSISDCDIDSQFAYIKSRRLPLSDIANRLLKNIQPLF